MAEGETRAWTKEDFNRAVTEILENDGNPINWINVREIECNAHAFGMMFDSLMSRVCHTGL